MSSIKNRNKNIKTTSNFIDLEEIKNPEEINLNNKNKISLIDSIEYTAEEQNIPVKNNALKKNNNIKKEKNIEKKKLSENSFNTNEINTNNDIEEFESSENKDSEKNINDLINKIDIKDNSIKYPGKIDIKSIDRSLNDININNDFSTTKEETEEAFGVNRVEVFYNIDKKIYSTRSSSTLNNDKMQNVKKGILLPSIVAGALFVFLFIFFIFWSIYSNYVSKSMLEEYSIKDNSILKKINEQQRKEAILAGQKLAEERRLLEEQKKQIENIINEELLKKESEIENKFKKKINDLESRGISNEEIERLKKKYEEDKKLEFENAKRERDDKIDEQNKQLEEKDQKLVTAMNKIKEESQKYEIDLARIQKEYEEKSKEETRQKEEANLLLSRMRENELKVKSFNSTVFQLISGAMNDFKKYNYDSSLKKLNAVLDYYNKNEDFIKTNEELKNKMDTDIFFVETITGLIRDSKNGIKFNNQYASIIDKFEKVAGYYKDAEVLYNNKKYSQSGKEYFKVLSVFNEINTSYEKIRDIEKKTQDDLAYNLYNKAEEAIKNKKYDTALSFLQSLIKNAPLSSYTNLALNQIIDINSRILNSNDANEQNEKAKLLMAKADSLKSTNSYNDALLLYHKIIMDFPGSSYIKKALEESNNISKILNEKDKARERDDLKSKFQDDYQKFENYYKKDDFANARIYYFEALRKAFDIYTNNSIKDFEKVEDKYIEKLLEDNTQKNLLSDNQKKIIKDLEKQKNELEDKYKNLLEETKKTTGISSKDKDILLKKYEKDFEEKNKEIERLKKYIEDKEKSLSEDDLQKKINEYQGKLQEEKEKAEVLKKQLYDQYEKEKKYLAENEKLKKMQNDLKDIKSKYDELEKKYNNKTISPEEREKIEKELKETLERKYELEKQSQLESTRNKIKEEYQQTLDKQMQLYTFKYEYIINGNNDIIGRITDINSKSVVFKKINDNELNKKANINKNDVFQIIRITVINDRKAYLVIGHLEVTSFQNDSLYGNGQIISIMSGYNIQIDDLLRR